MQKIYKLCGSKNRNFKCRLTRFLAHFAAFLILANGSLVTTTHAQSILDDKTLLVIGDSLSAGYNLPPGAGFPERLEDFLRGQGHDITVINAGVSGDTSSGGRARLGWAIAGMPAGPDLVIIELGGNDALRGIEPTLTRKNLSAMIEELKASGTNILLAGMQAPPNMGREYEAEFNALYADLANQYDIPLYPFFLDGVAANPDLNLADGIHPNEAGINVIVTRIAPLVKELLTE